MQVARALVGTAAVLFALIAACAHAGDIDPRAIAPVPGNPCGNIGVVCLDMQGRPSGFCCYEGETCGGGLYSVGCPAGACCNIRQLPGGSQWRPDAGAADGPTLFIPADGTRE